MTNTLTDLFTTVIERAVLLVGELNGSGRLDTPGGRLLSGELHSLFLALPPEPDLLERCQRTLLACREQAGAGEWKAARYQLVQLIRKLRNLRDEWRPQTSAPERVSVDREEPAFTDD